MIGHLGESFNGDERKPVCETGLCYENLKGLHESVGISD